jgi:DNA-binding protein HU-beta
MLQRRALIGPPLCFLRHRAGANRHRIGSESICRLSFHVANRRVYENLPRDAAATGRRCDRAEDKAMTKNELIALVADKTSMTKTAAASAVDATFDAITTTLSGGGDVKIMGFGNFRVVKRSAREGRDPRTGAPVQIKAANRPRFSAGKGLKEAVNA